MTPKERAAMQQALEFLESGDFVYPAKLATALREALGENNGTRNVDGNSEHSVTGSDGGSSVSVTSLAEQECPNGCDTSNGRCVDCPDYVAEQADEIDWIETNKALAKEIIEMKKQAEQEPVAWMWKPSKPFPQYTVITDNKKHLEAAKEQGVEITPLYAAPVHTKDLTDDEICKANKTEIPDCQDLVDFARAVIAADREKNT